MFSSIVLLTLGSLSPALAHLVPDIDTLQKNTIGTLERFAVGGSSIEEIHGIIVLLHSKTRVLKRAMQHIWPSVYVYPISKLEWDTWKA